MIRIDLKASAGQTLSPSPEGRPLSMASVTASLLVCSVDSFYQACLIIGLYYTALRTVMRARGAVHEPPLPTVALRQADDSDVADKLPRVPALVMRRPHTGIL